MHRRWTLTVALLFSTVSLAAASDDIAEAIRLLKGVQDEQAVIILTRALDRDEGTPSERAQLYVLLGIARYNLRDEEGSGLAFAKALELDPEVRLSKLASPKVRATFEEEQKRAKESRKVDVPRATKEPSITPSPSSSPNEVIKAGPSSPTPVRRWVGVGVGVVGVGLAVIGGVFVGESGSQRDAAVADPNALSAQTTFERAQSNRQLGWVLVGVGVAAAAAGAGVALWPTSDDGASASLSVGPGSVSLVGKF